MNSQTTTASNAAEHTAVDLVIVGAGVTGIHQLWRAQQSGLSSLLLEAGTGVGGVWHWNRYPGARLDSESYTYGFLFDEELFRDWAWQERFAGQPENERYFNHAVDHLGLRDRIRFNAKVTSARYDEETRTWLVTTADGSTVRARFVVAATGVLSVPAFPSVPGREDFQGESHHTGLWPKSPVDFRGKRVAVVGTGSSGVQVIPAILDDVASLTVYQRSPNWCTPLGNEPITPEQKADLDTSFTHLRAQLKDSASGFLHQRRDRTTFEDSADERLAFYEKMWTSPGFSKVISHYSDVMGESTANRAWCDFMAGKIRDIVSDPATADKLIPQDHGWAGKRPPFVTSYFEAYNDPRVELIDLRETPMTRVTETGIETTHEHREFDIIVWASGFDFGTGALTRMGVEGRGGVLLAQHWADGPVTFAGLMCHGFPNFFFPGGPHGAAGNNPRYAEDQVEFVADMIDSAAERGAEVVEAPLPLETKWTRMVEELAAYSSFDETSYFYGSNIEGKARRFLLNPGGRPKLREALESATQESLDDFFPPSDRTTGVRPNTEGDLQ